MGNGTRPQKADWMGVNMGSLPKKLLEDRTQNHITGFIRSPGTYIASPGPCEERAGLRLCTELIQSGS